MSSAVRSVAIAVVAVVFAEVVIRAIWRRERDG